MDHARRSIAASAASIANPLRPSPQAPRPKLIALAALLASAFTLPAACSNVDVSCGPPTFAVKAEPDDLAEHCAFVVETECQRAFSDCPDLGVYTIEFPDVTACLAEAPAMFCEPAQFSDAYLDDTESAACIAALPTVACAEFDQEGGPKACWKVERPVPPDPSGCQVVGAGKHEGKLDTEVSKDWGRFASLHCVCLEKGDPITIRVAHGDLDQPAIHLLGPTGEPVKSMQSEGPLRATAPAQGSYLVLVTESGSALKGQPVTVIIDRE